MVLSSSFLVLLHSGRSHSSFLWISYDSLSCLTFGSLSSIEEHIAHFNRKTRLLVPGGVIHTIIFCVHRRTLQVRISSACLLHCCNSNSAACNFFRSPSSFASQQSSCILSSLSCREICDTLNETLATQKQAQQVLEIRLCFCVLWVIYPWVSSRVNGLLAFYYFGCNLVLLLKCLLAWCDTHALTTQLAV